MNSFYLPGLLRYFAGHNRTWKSKNKYNSIYLTFDDGPHPDTTRELLRILNDNGIKASFFCVGENVEKHAELYREIIEQGHITGNHTYNHLNGWKVEKNEYINNVDKCNLFVNSTLFRPPYGRITKSQSRELSKKYDIIMWTVLAGDYDNNSSYKDCLKRMKRHTKSGSIIVLHDNIKTIEKVRLILPEYIAYCKSKGFTFDVLKSEKMKNI